VVSTRPSSSFLFEFSFPLHSPCGFISLRDEKEKKEEKVAFFFFDVPQRLPQLQAGHFHANF